MTGFRHDSFSRSRAGAAAPLSEAPRARGSLGLVISIALALMLLALSRAEHQWLTSAREELTSALEPALALARLPIEGARAIADAPIGESELLRQIADLEQENTELRQWRLRAQDLEGQVSELRRIVGGVPDRQIGIATGRIFVEGDPAFAASAIIDIGAAHGIKTGFAAINGDGLVGTIVAAGPRSARLLLLTDRRSRIPVFVGKERLRGILSGNGAGAPALELVAAAGQIENGRLDQYVGRGRHAATRRSHRPCHCQRRDPRRATQCRARPARLRQRAAVRAPRRGLGAGHLGARSIGAEGV